MEVELIKIILATMNYCSLVQFCAVLSASFCLRRFSPTSRLTVQLTLLAPPRAATEPASAILEILSLRLQ